MIGYLLPLKLLLAQSANGVKEVTINGVKEVTINGVKETPIDGVNFIPHIYNDHIGIQNVMVKSEKLLMRSSVDESAMVRWEIKNHSKSWSFVFEFNELNLESRESASISLFYTKEKPMIGSFKGGPSIFHGFVVGLQFHGKNVELMYARNDGKDFSHIDDYATLTDSLSPQRFLDLETLKLKLICTDKNFKVEIYNQDKLLYDNFRHFTKDYLKHSKEENYFSIFADYRHTSSGKAFELRNAQLYHRDETADYSVTKSNMEEIKTKIRSLEEIKHPDSDVQSLLFKLSAVTGYIKAILGDLPETAIVKAEKELIREVEMLSEKQVKVKNGLIGKKGRGELERRVNQLDMQFKKLSKMLSDIEYAADPVKEDGFRRYYLIFEYCIIFSGMFGISVIFFREMKSFLANRKSKMSFY